LRNFAKRETILATTPRIGAKRETGFMSDLNRRSHPAPTAPERIVHLGVGAFHRSHQAWYTQRANEIDPAWGIAAFTGRQPRVAQELSRQHGLYTLLVKDGASATTEIVSSLSSVHDGADGSAWAAAMSSPAVTVVTVTITEAGYLAGSAAIARLLDGLRARRAGTAGPLSIVSCDNLMGNGRALQRAVEELAEEVDPGLREWITERVGWVSSVVDRITPATTASDRELVARLSGYTDRSPVVTEPFSEWILEGSFVADRPEWERGGAVIVGDVAPWERRKLWLLNGAHSALAYLGPLSGATTVAEAMRHPETERLVEAYWREAIAVLGDEVGDLDAYLTSLRARFANVGIQHELAQIGRDGLHKLPARTLSVIRARLAAGLPAGDAATAVVAAWVHRIRRNGTGLDPEVGSILAALDGPLGGADRDARADVEHVLLALAPDLSIADVIDPVAYALQTIEHLSKGANS
jgi:fructuronate reductase